MIYLTARQVARMNATEVGPDLLRDRHLLESAVERPQASAFGEDAYPTIHQKAAALMQSLATNHPFIDGNKRTALLAVIAFYGLNAWEFTAGDVDLLHFVVDIATSTITEVAIIAEYLEKWVRPIPDPQD